MHKKMTWEQVKKNFARFEKLPEGPDSIGICASSRERFHRAADLPTGTVPWSTATRRIQFYIDQPLYDEPDELPLRFKGAAADGWRLSADDADGGKTRQSIHSTMATAR